MKAKDIRDEYHISTSAFYRALTRSGVPIKKYYTIEEVHQIVEEWKAGRQRGGYQYNCGVRIGHVVKHAGLTKIQANKLVKEMKEQGIKDAFVFTY